MKPESISRFIKKCGDRTYQLILEGDTPLGELHDVLMEWKGWCVDKMIEAHREEMSVSESQKQHTEIE